MSLDDWQDEEELLSKRRAQLVKAAKSRRARKTVILVILVILGLSFWVWNWYLRPQWNEESEYMEGFLSSQNEPYDMAKIGHFDGVRLQDLKASLLPGGVADPEGQRRLIFVGDIHGCARELKKLLKKVDFNEETDHLIAVGDVVSKGPDSTGVLDELLRLNADSVRGNHEDRVLALAPHVLDSAPLPTDETALKKLAEDSALLRQLSALHLQYLRNMPLMLRVPPLPMASATSHKSGSAIGEEIIVVHAGLVPAVPLEKQDPYFVMNMRSIHTKTHLPFAEAESKSDKTKPWHDIWCWYNDRLFKHKSLKNFRVYDAKPGSSDAPDDTSVGWLDWLNDKAVETSKSYPEPQVVVYGHRSKEGLQVERWTKGLDTGCVKGERLTALVLNAKGKQEIVQLKCDD